VQQIRASIVKIQRSRCLAVTYKVGQYNNDVPISGRSYVSLTRMGHAAHANDTIPESPPPSNMLVGEYIPDLAIILASDEGRQRDEPRKWKVSTSLEVLIDWSSITAPLKSATPLSRYNMGYL
jgi:hypothetical protein